MTEKIRRTEREMAEFIIQHGGNCSDPSILCDDCPAYLYGEFAPCELGLSDESKKLWMEEWRRQHDAS